MLVDSHCHLDFPELQRDFPGVLARARSAGVETMLAIGTKLAKFPGVRAIAEAHPNIFCTVGVHPHEASNEQAAVEALLALADHPKVVGIGETGLDYFYQKSPREPQAENFRAHMRAAHASGLPLVIHTRDADADTADLLDWAARELPGTTGVLHCFTSTLELAQKAIALGYYVSISGIVTFKNAEDLRATVRALPLERLLVETDSPYLAPIPKRGKPCEPSYVLHTAQFVADLKGVSLAELGRTTSDNFYRLFARARRPAA
ncbi:MAG: TatD family hydrolase [Proteobacteria bacterium]|nr:TatD family hydrolase [Pseudomonadota bacterium]